MVGRTSKKKRKDAGTREREREREREQSDFQLQQAGEIFRTTSSSSMESEAGAILAVW